MATAADHLASAPSMEASSIFQPWGMKAPKITGGSAIAATLHSRPRGTPASEWRQRPRAGSAGPVGSSFVSAWCGGHGGRRGRPHGGARGSCGRRARHRRGPSAGGGARRHHRPGGCRAGQPGQPGQPAADRRRAGRRRAGPGEVQPGCAAGAVHGPGAAPGPAHRPGVHLRAAAVHVRVVRLARPPGLPVRPEQAGRRRRLGPRHPGGDERGGAGPGPAGGHGSRRRRRSPGRGRERRDAPGSGQDPARPGAGRHDGPPEPRRPAGSKGWSASLGKPPSTACPRWPTTRYRQAETTLAAEQPGCGLRWELLAAIGKTESNHGVGRLDAAGNSQVAIIGIPIGGDTDGGALDGDVGRDHAVGPMQFIPSTWARWGTDANGDGKTDPGNIVDAATAAGRYLCRAAGRSDPDLRGRCHPRHPLLQPEPDLPPSRRRPLRVPGQRPGPGLVQRRHAAATPAPGGRPDGQRRSGRSHRHPHAGRPAPAADPPHRGPGLRRPGPRHLDHGTAGHPARRLPRAQPGARGPGRVPALPADRRCRARPLPDRPVRPHARRLPTRPHRRAGAAAPPGSRRRRCSRPSTAVPAPGARRW